MTMLEKVVPDHRWFLCELCGPAVRCGTCGNNCCNGGEMCDDCGGAYFKQAMEKAPRILYAIWLLKAIARCDARQIRYILRP